MVSGEGGKREVVKGRGEGMQDVGRLGGALWEWEHKDGSVDKEKGAGQGVWKW